MAPTGEIRMDGTHGVAGMGKIRTETPEADAAARRQSAEAAAIRQAKDAVRGRGIQLWDAMLALASNASLVGLAVKQSAAPALAMSAGDPMMQKVMANYNHREFCNLIARTAVGMIITHRELMAGAEDDAPVQQPVSGGDGR